MAGVAASAVSARRSRRSASTAGAPSGGLLRAAPLLALLLLGPATVLLSQRADAARDLLERDKDRVPITGSAPQPQQGGKENGDTGGKGGDSHSSRIPVTGKNGGGGGADVNVKVPTTSVSVNGERTTVVAPGTAVASKDGVTVVKAPLTVVANTPDQVAVRNTFTNVDVDKKTGSGSVVVPVVGRICWGEGCGRRGRLLQAPAAQSGGGSGSGSGSGGATVNVALPDTVVQGGNGNVTVSAPPTGVNVTRGTVRLRSPWTRVDVNDSSGR